MRVVADTNTIVSGLLWHGAPRQVLDAAREGTITLFISAVLLDELEEVLARPKFSVRLERVRLQPKDLAQGFSALATMVKPTDIPRVVDADVDDDAVIACAVAARAQAIVTGDNDLLRLKKYTEISILTAPELLAQISSAAD
jgi:putative PIN family toxin of toxin-antitoxin system